jgi:hypothetical protein
LTGDLKVEVPDFNVDHVQSGVGAGMVTTRIPGAGIEVDFGKLSESHATPISACTQAAVAATGDLVAQALEAASLGAKCVGTQQSALAVVRGNYRNSFLDRYGNG